MKIHSTISQLNWHRAKTFDWSLAGFGGPYETLSAEDQAVYRKKEELWFSKWCVVHDVFQTRFSVEEQLFHAIRRGDAVHLRYLLDHGVDPNTENSWQGTIAMAHACQLGQLECARLLRAYGADLACIDEMEAGPGRPSKELLRLLAPGSDRLERFGLWGSNSKPVVPEEALARVRAWLASKPATGREIEVVCPAPRRCTEQWQRIVDPPPEINPRVAKVLERWYDAKREFWVPVIKKRWGKVRMFVKARGVVLFWQERTHAALCAPGGKGRVADREAFEASASRWMCVD